MPSKQASQPKPFLGGPIRSLDRVSPCGAVSGEQRAPALAPASDSAIQHGFLHTIPNCLCDRSHPLLTINPPLKRCVALRVKQPNPLYRSGNSATDLFLIPSRPHGLWDRQQTNARHTPQSPVSSRLPNLLHYCTVSVHRRAPTIHM